MKKKKLEIKSRSLVTPLLYFVYLVVVWSFYRMDFKFSDTLEELYIKPVIWLLPFLYIIPLSFLLAIFAYILLGPLIVKLVTLLQYGF